MIFFDTGSKMDTLSYTTTYLEMTERPSASCVIPPSDNLEIKYIKKPSIELYRYLYNTVGQDWMWFERRIMSDADLARETQDDLVEIYLLYVSGKLAGYVEIDRRYPPDVEISYLGIIPDFCRQGLGKYLLYWAIDLAWSYNPKRVWIHTCSLDNPVALEMYKKAGFRIYKTESTTIPFPHGVGFE